METRELEPSEETQLDFIINEYFEPSKVTSKKRVSSGHINKTYFIQLEGCSYILQKINTHVFPNPDRLMTNIEKVTDHIRMKAIYFGKNPERSVLSIIKSKDGHCVTKRNNQYWRCFRFIDKAKTCTSKKTKETFEEVGRVVGEFQSYLCEFHAADLEDTIEHFHDTPHRYEHFKDVVRKDEFQRKGTCLEEIEFINNHQHIYNLITDKLDKGLIPLRVTHNDTKLSNVMVDEETGKGLCLIDFDTVMKGSLLYDYGDALRLGASTAAEDEKDLSKVHIDLEMIESFSRGFLKEVKSIITKDEIEGLYNGYLIETIEVAMRFLDDYLDGDRYFDIQYSNHNLIRSRNQIKLVKEIEAKEQEIKTIINNVLIELDFKKEFLLW